jgi:LuxR family glucitol operon transcriptional activator
VLWGFILVITGLTYHIISSFISKPSPNKEEGNVDLCTTSILSSELTPYKLPPRQGIIGREKEIQDITKDLKTEIPVIFIEGFAGIGKTSLAINLSHLLIDNKTFKQVIWLSAKGRSLDLSSLLDEIIIGLDLLFMTNFPIDKKSHEVLSYLKSEAILIVIDNFETLSSEEKDEILTFSTGISQLSKTLITTRPLMSNDCISSSLNVNVYHLSGLSYESAFKLIEREFKRVTSSLISKDIANKLYELTKGSPLFLILSIGQLSHGYSIQEIIYNLENAKGDIFDKLFSETWTLLGDNEKYILKYSSLFADSFQKDSLYFLTKMTMDEFNKAFKNLLLDSLIQSNGELVKEKLRFELHPLTKAYSESNLTETEKYDFKITLAEYFIEYSKIYQVKFWEGREIYEPLEMERINITSIMIWCWQNNLYSLFISLSKSISDFLIVKGHWQLCLDFGKKAATAANIEQDKYSEAWILVHMQGYLYANVLDFVNAEKVLIRATDLLENTEFKKELSEAKRNLARVFRKNKDFNKANDLYNQSYLIAKETKDKKLISLILNEQGKLYRDNSNFDKAMELFDEAKNNIEDIDNSIYAGILCNMAGVAIDTRDIDSAKIYSHQSLKYFNKIDNKEGIATSKWRLAEIEEIEKNHNAYNTAKEAFEIFTRLGMKNESIELQKIMLRTLNMSKGTDL